MSKIKKDTSILYTSASIFLSFSIFLQTKLQQVCFMCFYVTEKCLWRTWQVQSTAAENLGRKEVKVRPPVWKVFWGRPDLHTLA